MKRILKLSAILLLIFSLCGCEQKEKYPEPTEQFFVNDFADVIDDTQEGDFVSKAATLEKATTSQVVIVTVGDLGGDEPFEYATELGRKWGVGNEESDNGIIILLSRDDREIFVAVGYGLEGALPDSKTGRIIDVYGLSYLKNDDFSTGLLKIGEAIINEVYIEYGLAPADGYVNIENVSPTVDSDGGEVVASWVIMLVVLIVISLLSRRRGGGIFFFGMPHIHHGGHSGGFRSGGGGFGGFRGGGGSFGGGGAGRGF
ncbi:MAG: TPM domain-containing protein [Clostridia bacterium]|nr:TPM domain-containing protein [Clostridia bacterium]